MTEGSLRVKRKSESVENDIEIEMSEDQEKPRRRKDARPTEIIQAAMEIFTECGFANAKIVDIAKRAGAARMR